jgi:uncharacterized RDD family membrane protein YckC
MTEAPGPIVAWEVPQEPAGPAPGVVFAPHGERFAAYFLDGLVVAAVYLLLSLVAFVPVLVMSRADGEVLWGPAGVAAFILFFVIAFGVAIAYFPYFWQRSGQTPGMRLFRLHVVRDRDGGPLSWGTSWLRLLGLYVAATVFYLGFIWVFVDKRRRGWHDLIAGTVVIKRS